MSTYVSAPPSADASAVHEHAHAHRPLGGRLLTLPALVAALFVVIMLFVLAERFASGLGAVTNLSDGYPWGIWVAVDIVIGTAFGCAGYVMAALVYILNKGEYHPLVRPAVMASLFGYGLAGVAVLIDLGRYWNFYHLLLPWYAQPNSVMLEVGLCVAAYVTVLLIEFSPAVLERFGFEDAKRKLNRVLFVFIGLGVLLPTMHQSSLGTMMVVLGNKLSPLWQTQMLPVFFLMTAILMGFAMVVWEGVLSSAGFRRPSEAPILGRLSKLMLWTAAAFIVLRFVDLAVRGKLGAMVSAHGTGMFWVETVLMVCGTAILVPAANRTRNQALFVSSSLLLAGGIVYRLNVYLVGLQPAIGPWSYFPSIGEILVTAGIFALEVLLYLVFVKTLPIMHAVDAKRG